MPKRSAWALGGRRSMMKPLTVGLSSKGSDLFDGLTDDYKAAVERIARHDVERFRKNDQKIAADVV